MAICIVIAMLNVNLLLGIPVALTALALLPADAGAQEPAPSLTLAAAV